MGQRGWHGPAMGHESSEDPTGGELHFHVIELQVYLLFAHQKICSTKIKLAARWQVIITSGFHSFSTS